MTAPRRIALFALVLAAAFGAAALAGAAIDPTDDRPAATAHGDRATGGHGADGDDGNHGSAGDGGDHGADASAGHEGAPDEHGADAEAGGHGAAGHTGAALGGLAVADGGLTLALDDTVRRPGRTQLRFRILGADGRPVTRGYEVEHDKRLHLIVVRRDTGVFRHLHPRLRPDGTWQATADLPEAGDHRVFADFKTGGEKRVLATDLAVRGDYEPRAWPAPAASGRTDTGGLDVALAGADRVRAGRETTLRFAVTRDGAPLHALQPYLGARGHLVALREGDLGYLHVHPLDGDDHTHADGSTGAAHGNEIAFAATFPTAGRYRLFLQVRTGGAVRTVPYTLQVGR